MYLVYLTSHLDRSSVLNWLHINKYDNDYLIVDDVEDMTNELFADLCDLIVFDYKLDITLIDKLRELEGVYDSIQVFVSDSRIGEAYLPITENIQVLPKSLNLMVYLWQHPAFYLGNILNAEEVNEEVFSVDEFATIDTENDILEFNTVIQDLGESDLASIKLLKVNKYSKEFYDKINDVHTEDNDIINTDAVEDNDIINTNTTDDSDINNIEEQLVDELAENIGFDSPNLKGLLKYKKATLMINEALNKIDTADIINVATSNNDVEIIDEEAEETISTDTNTEINNEETISTDTNTEINNEETTSTDGETEVLNRDTEETTSTDGETEVLNRDTEEEETSVGIAVEETTSTDTDTEIINEASSTDTDTEIINEDNEETYVDNIVEEHSEISKEEAPIDNIVEKTSAEIITEDNEETSTEIVNEDNLLEDIDALGYSLADIDTSGYSIDDNKDVNSETSDIIVGNEDVTVLDKPTIVYEEYDEAHSNDYDEVMEYKKAITSETVIEDAKLETDIADEFNKSSDVMGSVNKSSMGDVLTEYSADTSGLINYIREHRKNNIVNHTPEPKKSETETPSKQDVIVLKGQQTYVAETSNTVKKVGIKTVDAVDTSNQTRKGTLAGLRRKIVRTYNTPYEYFCDKYKYDINLMNEIDKINAYVITENQCGNKILLDKELYSRKLINDEIYLDFIRNYLRRPVYSLEDVMRSDVILGDFNKETCLKLRILEVSSNNRNKRIILSSDVQEYVLTILHQKYDDIELYFTLDKYIDMRLGAGG